MAKNITLFSVYLVVSLCLLCGSTVTQANCTVWVASVQDTINPMVSEYLIEMIAKAEKANVNALLIELDTPGGLVESTRKIVVKIMNSDVPVITYVSPHGARAASAGMFITIASHIAAMAPATNIGAAHPVSMGPMGPIERKDDESTPTEPVESAHQVHAGYLTAEADFMNDKIMNDLLAWARTIAEQRGRNSVWVENAIRDSISSTEKEALDEGVVDLVCENRASLLAELNGRTIKIGDREIRLNLENCLIVEKPMTWRQKFLSILINPTLAIYLLALGGLGLYFELSHPGFIVPGVIGGICLILGLFAMHTLPINTAGLLLILLSFVFFALEVKMPSYGVLTIGGIASFVLGSTMLVDSEVSGMQVSLQAIIPLAFAVALITIILIALVIRSHRETVSTGDSGLIGDTGRVTRTLAPEGHVYVHGEIWRARSVDEREISENTEIVVMGLTGLTLLVKPLDRSIKEDK
ncbi:nodulation protein NfeD [bacterium]|nr:nodulation protein NfeD [candidate division CSSED10-310 bacterium]